VALATELLERQLQREQAISSSSALLAAATAAAQRRQQQDHLAAALTVEVERSRIVASLLNLQQQHQQQQLHQGALGRVLISTPPLSAAAEQMLPLILPKPLLTSPHDTAGTAGTASGLALERQLHRGGVGLDAMMKKKLTAKATKQKQPEKDIEGCVVPSERSELVSILASRHIGTDGDNAAKPTSAEIKRIFHILGTTLRCRADPYIDCAAFDDPASAVDVSPSQAGNTGLVGPPPSASRGGTYSY